MCPNLTRRCFLRSTAAGALSLGAFAALAERLTAATASSGVRPKPKVRVG